MKFRLVESEIDEDLKSKYGFSFQDLMHAAENGDGDFVLNPIPTDDVIDLPEEQWNKLYDIMFDTDDDDTVYTIDEYLREAEREDTFSKRYNCI